MREELYVVCVKESKWGAGSALGEPTWPWGGLAGGGKVY